MLGPIISAFGEVRNSAEGQARPSKKVSPHGECHRGSSRPDIGFSPTLNTKSRHLSLSCHMSNCGDNMFYCSVAARKVVSAMSFYAAPGNFLIMDEDFVFPAAKRQKLDLQHAESPRSITCHLFAPFRVALLERSEMWPRLSSTTAGCNNRAPSGAEGSGVQIPVWN